MIAILTGILILVATLLLPCVEVIQAQSVKQEIIITSEPLTVAEEWDEYHALAYNEYADEFTALFNSYEVKRAKNGAMMIRVGNSGSYKFAKKG